MYVITPTAVAQLFNNHMAGQDPGGDWSCINPPDYWEKLTDEDREEHLEAVWLYIDKRMTNLDEDIRDVFDRVRKDMKHWQIAVPSTETEQERT